MSEKIDFDDLEYEKIRNASDKKPKMAILNQKKVSKWELDELFSEGQQSSDEYFEEM